jgi:hypothetical protein
MITPMSKLTFASTLVIACLAGCSERTTSSPASDPSDVEVEFDGSDSDEFESDDELDAESYESEEAEPVDEVEQADLDESEPAADEPAEAEEEPPQKACSELPQKTCQVTVGCAWSTDKKCVDQ